MNLHKYATDTLGGIKSNTYSSHFRVLDILVAEALSDFPDLVRGDIRTVVYGGDRWKGMTGIEFTIPTSNRGSIPNDYHRIDPSQLEGLLNP